MIGVAASSEPLTLVRTTRFREASFVAANGWYSVTSDGRRLELRLSLGPCARQQLVEAALRVIADASEHVGEVEPCRPCSITFGTPGAVATCSPQLLLGVDDAYELSRHVLDRRGLHFAEWREFFVAALRARPLFGWDFELDPQTLNLPSNGGALAPLRLGLFGGRGLCAELLGNGRIFIRSVFGPMNAFFS